MAKWLGVCTRVAVLVAVAAAGIPAEGRAADLYVAAGQSLQAAIDRAVPGDRILLQPGATFSGNFRLPNKGPSTEWITIRSAAADLLLPPDGTRVSPADAPNLPVIRSSNTMSAMVASAGAHHWHLQYLEFRANDRGYGDIIALGAGDGTQTSVSQAPLNLLLDHLYVHGDPVIGQKRAIALHSGATWIRDCYVSDIKAVGVDTQAIMGYNGPGPWTVENNYLEAAGENVLVGGASPKIPNLIPADLVFRSNHLFKPLSWRNPILTAPAMPALAASPGGALPAGTYSYRIVAARRTAQDTWTFSTRSPESAVSVIAGSRVSVSWPAVPNATIYRVYRGSVAGAQDRYFDSTGTTFVDDGTAAGTAGTGDTMTGTVWSVKNLFELKLGERVTVEGNVMENCWQQSQAGFAILLTPRNQDNTSPWIYVRDVHLSNNLVRHAGSGVQITGYDNNATSQRTERITIRSNVFDDIAPSRWGGGGRLVQMSDGVVDVVIDHNVAVQEAQIVYAYGGTYGAEIPMTGFVLTNNLFKHNTYGISGDRRASGNDTLNAYFPGAIVQRNTFAGGLASRYPADNEFPTVAEWQAQFVDYAASNFHLVPSSSYRAHGTDGLDLGPDMDAIDAAVEAALSGHDPDLAPTTPVAIATSGLPDGLSGSSYEATLTATGGRGTYTWRLVSGALPAGLLLDNATGIIAGTPTVPGIASFTVSVQDARDQSNVATASFDLQIVSTPPTVTLVSPVSGATITGTTVALSASASDADGRVTRVDFYANDQVIASASAAPWNASWTTAAPGNYTISASATDDSGLTSVSNGAPISVIETVPVSTTGRPVGEIVMHLAAANPIVGKWQRVSDSSAASGYRVQTPDRGVAAPSAPAAAPGSYVEAAFDAPAGVGYHVWVRVRAAGNSRWNDSTWLQFSESVSVTGAPLYRIGSTDALLINLENCDGCGVTNWGWQDKAWYGTRSDVWFATGGRHTLRIQLREDGTQLDQVVLTPVASGAGAPGGLRNDKTILPATPISSTPTMLISAAAVPAS